MMTKLDRLKANLSKGSAKVVEGESFKAESSQIKGMVGEQVFDLLVKYKTYLAGGAITSLFTNKDVNDLDIYFRSEEDLIMAMAEVMCEADLDCPLDNHKLIFSNVSARTIMLKDSETGQEVQFMTFKYFKTPDEIFNTFDFTCVMGCYSFETDKFIMHPDFFKHNSQKYLKFNSGTAYPIMSLLRVDKYQERGYTISKPEMLRVIFQCMSLNIGSWDDAIDHMAGMYGYDMEDVFDTSKEFSCESLVTQLDNIQERDIKKYSTSEAGSCDLYSILSEVIDIKEEVELEDDPKFDTTKYYYKCVGPDWMSPVSGNKLNYTEGSVIPACNGPIYVHSSTDDPHMNSLYWVELELLNGGVSTVHSWCSSEKTIKGDVKVVRNFLYQHPKHDRNQERTRMNILNLYPHLSDFLS